MTNHIEDIEQRIRELENTIVGTTRQLNGYLLDSYEQAFQDSVDFPANLANHGRYSQLRALLLKRMERD